MYSGRRFDADKIILRNQNTFNEFNVNIKNTVTDSRNVFIRCFKQLGASKRFISALEDMFNYKVDYEDPSTNPLFNEEPYGPWATTEDEIKEGAWDNMVDLSRRLDKLAKKEKLYDKMVKKY